MEETNVRLVVFRLIRPEKGLFMMPLKGSCDRMFLDVGVKELSGRPPHREMVMFANHMTKLCSSTTAVYKLRKSQHVQLPNRGCGDSFI